VTRELRERDAGVLLNESLSVGVGVENQHLFALTRQHRGDRVSGGVAPRSGQRQPRLGSTGGLLAQSFPGVAIDIQRRQWLESVRERQVAALQRLVGGIDDEHHTERAKRLERRQGDAEAGLDPEPLVIGRGPVGKCVTRPVAVSGVRHQRTCRHRRWDRQVDQQDAALWPACEEAW
jgi:hypothetical protein